MTPGLDDAVEAFTGRRPSVMPRTGSDPLGPARGILIGAVLSLPFWAVVAYVVVKRVVKR